MFVILKKQRPEIPVIFLSGYSQALLFERGSIVAGAEFIPKPISPSTLLRKVGQMLATKGSAPNGQPR